MKRREKKSTVHIHANNQFLFGNTVVEIISQKEKLLDDDSKKLVSS